MSSKKYSREYRLNKDMRRKELRNLKKMNKDYYPGEHIPSKEPEELSEEDLKYRLAKYERIYKFEDE